MTYAQESGKKIMLYSDGDPYLQTYIEKTLKSLLTRENDSLFSKVSVLNRFIDENNYQSQFQLLLNTYLEPEEQFAREYNAEEKKIRRLIKERLEGNDLLLKVKTITLVELIEFQFQLFEKSTKGDGGSGNNIDKLKASEDIFINPKDPDYKTLVKNSIQKLFKESNRRPKVKIMFLGDSIANGETLRVPIDTEFVLDGSNSGDYETENLRYEWRNIISVEQTQQTTNKIDFVDNKAVQKVTIDKEGLYKIGFKVYDGIEYSDEVVINLITAAKPQRILLTDSIIYTRRNRSISSFSIHEQEFRGYFKLLNDTLDVKDIVISDKELGPKLRASDNFENPVITMTKDSIQSIVVKDNFETGKDKIRYIYSKSKENYLSEPVQLLHKLQHRSVFTFSTKTSFSFLSFMPFSEPYTIREINTVETAEIAKTKGVEKISQKIDFNMNITNNIELSISLPLNRKNFKYRKFNIDYPALNTFYLRYNGFIQNIGKSESDVTFLANLLYKAYTAKDSRQRDFLNDRPGFVFYYQSIGYGLGLKAKLFDRERFRIDLLAEYSWSWFLESELSDFRDFEISTGLIFTTIYK